MKRRSFFKKSVKSALGASILPIGASACSTPKSVAETQQPEKTYANTDPEQWHQMGTGKKPRPDRRKTVSYEVAVVGG